uniref:Cytochrome P450 n=1 Tax=Bionectria ochroleuca TaxID=29856 RepID=A0A0B7KRT2_BIOOC
MPSDINSTCLQIQGLVNFNYTSYRYVIWHLLSLSFNFYYVLRSVGGAAGSAFLLLTAKYIYRLLLSPLSCFPGPRFAACSKLFEAYHVLIKNDWLDMLEALHHEHGSVVRIGPNELHFSDHQFCLQHHKRPDLYKCDNYYGILSYLLGGFADPAHHKTRKAILQPLFSGRTLADFSDSGASAHLDTLVDRLSESSHATGYLKTQDLKAVHDSTRAFSAIDLATVLRSMPPIKMVFNCVPSLRCFSPLGWIDQKISNNLKLIKSNSVHEKGQKSVLAMLSQQLPEEHILIHALAQAVFIGNESLLSNLTVLLHHLIKNPDCIRRIRAELDELDVGLYGHRIWRDPKVIRLKYLTSLSFTLKLLEHDPTLYPEPLKFKPERWLETNPDSAAMKRSSVTFGTGTRTCLGQFIAHQVLRRTVAALVYNFSMTFADELSDEMGGYTYLNTYPKKGHEGYLKLHFPPRFSP